MDLKGIAKKHERMEAIQAYFKTVSNPYILELERNRISDMSLSELSEFVDGDATPLDRRILVSAAARGMRNAARA